MYNEKKQLRKRYAERRAAGYSSAACEAIAERLFASELMRYRAFFVYLSFGSEADTRGIVNGLLHRDKRVLVPKIVEGEMIAVPYSAPFRRGKYGIEEPVNGEEEMPEVSLTPLLAFDKAFTRLGYGGGYYDKYFAKRQTVLRIGLAFSFQEADRLPKEETDIPLDGVITERDFLFREKGENGCGS